MKRTCEWADCGQTFETSSQRARFCSSTCRSRNSRALAAGARPTPKKPAAKKAAAKAPAKKTAAATSGGSNGTPKDEEHAFVKATRRELVDLEAADTMLGHQVITIAERMGRGAETGAAMASLSKEHSRLMADIRARAKGKDEDPVEAARKAHGDNVARAQAG